MLLNQGGLVVGWECDTDNVYDAAFHPLIEKFEGEMIVLSDPRFNCAGGNPKNLKLCKRGTWNV